MPLARNYLTSRFSRLFSSRVRKRGHQIAGRSVRILEGSADAVSAVVEGSYDYSVDVELVNKEVRVSCTCPYFNSSGPCKHIWAVLRQAELGGHLLSAATVGQLVPDDGFSDLDEDDEDDFLGWPPPTPAPRPPEWRRRLAALGPSAPIISSSHSVAQWPPDRQVIYILNVPASARARHPVLEFAVRDRKKNGEWSVPKNPKLDRDEIGRLRSPEDREILAELCGATEYYPYGYYGSSVVPSSLSLRSPLDSLMLPRLSKTGRLFARTIDYGAILPLKIGEGGAWRLVLEISKAGKKWALSAFLQRDEDRIPLTQPELVLGGWIFLDGRLDELDYRGEPYLLDYFREEKQIEFPAAAAQEFLAELLARNDLPELIVPEELRYEVVTEPPTPALFIKTIDSGHRRLRWAAALWFRYPGAEFSTMGRTRSSYDPAERRLVRRDSDGEAELVGRIRALGFKNLPAYLRDDGFEWEIAQSKFPEVVRRLTAEGWPVEVDGAAFRQAGEMRIEVTTGIDWFDVGGSVEFGDTEAGLPELLKALRDGKEFVPLADGGMGLIPEDWRGKLGLLAATAQTEGGAMRFRRGQAALLDALLAAQPAVSVDEAFRRIREELRSFDGIEEAPQPEGFVGTLRGYQREGVGWFEFLRRFGLGGCLADDMGVGKTIQVLALLEHRRELRAAGKVGEDGQAHPTLVVAPRSVIFNWIEEARRFTPKLRLLDYTGAARSLDGVEDCDLVLTTYGTLRRDAVKLRDVAFGYAILDEAQAIKNARTASAKAARLLDAKHRLALTGTPVENHLGELWSIFEFLNPGMLGASSMWQSSSGAMRKPDPQVRDMLRRALRPYILRRTKSQVASELPEKLEQTLHCELKPKQRKLYDELRRHYRDSLLGRIKSTGLAKSKMHVLEALLRLRQAACHPGLIDSARAGGPSAKLDSLLPMLEETVTDGHKVLVFSQFTSFLALLQAQLDERGWIYEYLDGKTRDRKTRVERFQSDPDCRLFLISLKAGGLGLNLTAADYVFLLDPWWNPAVESQAIDRAHRIGQSRRVFAYRLVARDTVEEKVIELQNTKRELADAIISEDNSIIRNLRAEDLELLLS